MRSSKTRVISRFIPVLVALVVSGLFVAVVLALFTNGGFETGDFTGWTKTTFLNPGLIGSQPFTGADIVRTAGGHDQSVVLGPFPTMSQSDPNTGGNLRYPRFGDYSARINGSDIYSVSNSIVQSSTVAVSDINPIDGQIHIMFAYAPVLQDPSHNPNDQPYFYIAVKNLTRGGALLYEKFIFSGQSGVPWQTYSSAFTTTVRYTDWQIVDIVPGASNIAVGDDIELEVIGADCALGGHFGYVYVDVFGSSIPTLYVVKKAPALVYPDSDFVYNFTYGNNSSSVVSNAVAIENIPAKTTFVGADSGCGHNAGVVTCTLGTLSPGITGTFQITVHVNSGETGTVDNGNYYIYGDGMPALLGPLVTTPIANLTADLSINKTLRIGFLTNITFTISVRNLGPSQADGAVVSDTMPANVTGMTWTCSGSGGATCTAGGSGNIYDTLTNFPAGGVVTYTVPGTLNEWDYVRNTATVTAPSGVSDPTPDNNSKTAYTYRVYLIVTYKNSLP